MNTTELKALAEKAPKGRWDVGSYYIWRGDDRWHPVHVQKRGLMAETKTAAMSAWVAAANPAAILELIAQLEDARTQMERQKDEWLSWEAKRRDLEKAAAQLEDAQGEIRDLRATEAGLRERVKALEFGLSEVETLMNESEGVAGLHLNGDVAPWSELRSGGRFEEWLLGFDEARALLEKKE